MTLSYALGVDRAASIFNLKIAYSINGYTEPGTGTFFGNTAWTALIFEVPGSLIDTVTGTGGFNATATVGVVSDTAPALFRYRVEFTAANVVSGLSVSQAWSVFSAAYAIAAQSIAGTAAADVILGGAGDDSIQALGGNDLIDGGGGNDTIHGGEGNDQIDGGAGNDSMIGGSGDDIYMVQSTLDRVIEALDGGTDLVRVSGLASYALGANVESLETTGNANFRGVGNGLNNRITGGGGNDVLDGGDGSDELNGGDGNDLLIGGAGADALNGGNGTDTVTYAASPGAVTVNLGSKSGLGGHAQGDWLIGIETVIGSNGNDVLVGNAIANTLIGGLGNDTIGGGGGRDVVIGGAGEDSMDGGADIDTLSYYGSTAGGIIVDLDKQLGTALGGDAQGDYISNFENLIGGFGDDMLSGDNQANILNGSLGNDTILGGGGNDFIIGGAGADSMDGGAGIDTVAYDGSTVGVTILLSVSSVHAGDAQGDTIVDFENARGGDGNDEITGSNGDNALGGGLGADRIDGNGGNDAIIGGAGGDTMDGGDGVDLLSYSGSIAGAVTIDLLASTASGGDATGDAITGFENVFGSDGNDFLLGDNNGNYLGGSLGADRLDGRGGNDLLVGGAGDDTFVFGTGYGHDTIADFTAGPISPEVIALSLGAAFDTFAEVMAVAKSFGPGGQSTVFQFGADTTLTLAHVTKASLVAGDFQF